jgi:hypothetical protein
MILFIVAIAAIALGGAVYFKNSNEAAVTSEGSTTTEVTEDSGIADMLGAAEDAATAMENGLGGNVSTTESPTVNEETSMYANGAYTKTGTYTSPAGSETVTISITLADDIVASATFTGNATNPGSVNNQAKFAAGYSDLVVGKNIDEIALTVVNGSSLTPDGFMDALALVKADAKI